MVLIDSEEGAVIEEKKALALCSVTYVIGMKSINMQTHPWSVTHWSCQWWRDRTRKTLANRTKHLRWRRHRILGAAVIASSARAAATASAALATTIANDTTSIGGVVGRVLVVRRQWILIELVREATDAREH